ncbi:hypothetical protein PV04_02701 [Phialophora macrospora]|uniref:Uncharacterized protein n=1 Tax=Phialophora macrospora TaxID=1851006 RepID=A0A0D2CYZ8_9EURO|nr:hypothetical protein PV04_02701 [Phialophora macrospora]
MSRSKIRPSFILDAKKAMTSLLILGARFIRATSSIASHVIKGLGLADLACHQPMLSAHEPSMKKIATGASVLGPRLPLVILRSFSTYSLPSSSLHLERVQFMTWRHANCGPHCGLAGDASSTINRLGSPTHLISPLWSFDVVLLHRSNAPARLAHVSKIGNSRLVNAYKMMIPSVNSISWMDISPRFRSNNAIAMARCFFATTVSLALNSEIAATIKLKTVEVWCQLSLSAIMRRMSL